MYPKNKVKTSQQPMTNGGVLQKTEDRNDATSPDNILLKEKNWNTDGI